MKKSNLILFYIFVLISPQVFADMKVEKKHHIDKGEKNEDGHFDYYYEYDIYEFCEKDICFVARSYTDEKESAHFLRKIVGKEIRPVQAKDLKTSLFKSAVVYLKESGKAKIKYLSENGYQEI